ncbi:hypothetical protein DSO57_1025139 [Entomophthora muscae]|uniref:Uncharacterized protein n=1 Tax=Entomophthora muscae TaxID=34485 RepID=A0ACC2RTA8_9FUNG|nr:hypothetical protein DSO57_1025139 [Entomophthora muscae]
MIQDLPNSRRCHKYNWQDFEMMDPKHVPTRKWHVPPADDSVSATDSTVDPSASSATQGHPASADSDAASSALTEHAYELRCH